MRDGKVVICEAGCGPLSMCFGAQVWQQPNTHVILFEPQPHYAAEIRAAAAGRPNVELYEVAIGDEPGRLELSDEGTSSSLVGVASPSVQHKGDVARKTFTVDVARISDFDKGDIDMLRLDTEGNEWPALKHLVSRPEQIVVEIYNDLATYINPHLYDIMRWCEQNGYKRARVHESDFMFVKDTVQPSRPWMPLPATFTLDQSRSAVKQMLIAGYTNYHYGKVTPEQFVDNLHRIFQYKTKVIENLAQYVHKEWEAGRHPQFVLESLDFFAVVLNEYLDKNTNQPKRA